jgi:hypothetical protein
MRRHVTRDLLDVLFNPFFYSGIEGRGTPVGKTTRSGMAHGDVVNKGASSRGGGKAQAVQPSCSQRVSMMSLLMAVNSGRSEVR